MRKTKSAFALVALLLMVLTLSGCKEDGIPRIDVITSVWRMENKIICIDRKYTLNDSHPYDMVESSAGMDVIIHFDAQEGAPHA